MFISEIFGQNVGCIVVNRCQFEAPIAVDFVVSVLVIIIVVVNVVVVALLVVIGHIILSCGQ